LVFNSWYVFWGIVFVFVSAILYFLQINIFHSTRDTFFYLFQDLAFVPIQVMLVSFIINQLLERREKENFFKKLNMVISVFFSEIGYELLKKYKVLDADFEKNKQNFLIQSEWKDNDYKNAIKNLSKIRFSFVINQQNLESLKQFLLDKRTIMLRLLENENLLEHEDFSDMLLAISHLTEELEFRKSFQNLYENDKSHLAKDIERFFYALLKEYFLYMMHLKNNYPYLFSLYVRVNPFTGKDTAEII